ncbi:hypothetical protein EMCRGX_G009515 [Ephydatia muelleri]
MQGSNYVCPSCFHLLRRRCFAPDGFDAVSVQNVGSTYIIVSWDLPTHSNGILINFSLYCNGALAGVLPLTVISYDTTGLLLFTLYMYMSSSHAHRHCTPVGTWCWASSVLQPACPGTTFNHLVCVPSFFALIHLSSFLSFSPVSPTPSLPPSLPPPFLPPFLLPSLLPSSPLLPSPLLPSLSPSFLSSCSHVHVHQQGHLWQNYTYHLSSLPPSYLPSPSPPHFPLLLQYIVIPTFSA